MSKISQLVSALAGDAYKEAKAIYDDILSSGTERDKAACFSGRTGSAGCWPALRKGWSGKTAQYSGEAGYTT